MKYVTNVMKKSTQKLVRKTLQKKIYLFSVITTFMFLNIFISNKRALIISRIGV